ncbi:hypothetical protein ACWDUL_33590 [Nocardia niigatensis]
MTTNQSTTYTAAPTDGGTETDRTLTLWVHTEELWRDLEAAAGLTRYALGRFKEWNALGPAHFGADQYDLDAMIRWARAHGIPHTDERAIHYSGTTGLVDLTNEQLTLNTAEATGADQAGTLAAELTEAADEFDRATEGDDAEYEAAAALRRTARKAAEYLRKVADR